ncbi:uncharacterized protein [Argopecten irradians]|uniref:uncharacterized protein n=1 Tax=Argopecten irradians TaxID=31199 RepID=UPI0037100011
MKAVEIERILNDRPLTYVPSDLLDEDPITPSHLLHGRKLSSLPYPISNTEDIQTSTTTHVHANKLYRVQVQVLEHFWSRWKREYLTSLREYQCISGNNDQKLKVGDVMLVYNDSPRNKWPLAIIEKLAVGGDGLVRSATIRTKNGTTTRPIGKLYSLEINVEDDVVHKMPELDRLLVQQRLMLCKR